MSNKTEQNTFITLEDVFDRSLLSVIESYICQIRSMIQSYDYTVVLARKAVCYFLALKRTGYLDGVGLDSVVSTRALSFDCGAVAGLRFENRNVAIIDDVVISGKSIERVHKLIRDERGSCDVCVAAFSDELLRGDSSFRLDRFHALSRASVFRLTKNITTFLQGCGITNNVDQPYLVAQMGSDTAEALVSDYVFDVSTALQKRLGIINKTIVFEPGNLLTSDARRIFGDSDPMLKIRVLPAKSRGCLSVIPFAIMPPLSDDKIQQLFDLVADDVIRQYVGDSRSVHAMKNKLQMVQYAISLGLGKRALGFLGMEEVENDEFDFERIVYGMPIEPHLEFSRLTSQDAKLHGVPIGGFWPYELDQCLGHIRSSLFVQNYTDKLQEASKWRVSTDELRAVVHNLVAEGVVCGNESVVLSACIDALIDEGVLVPFASEQSNRDGVCTYVRSYRGGEIQKLTFEQVDQFGVMLNMFLESSSFPFLRRDAINKLALLYLESKRGADERMYTDYANPLSFSYEADGVGLKRNRSGANLDYLGNSLVDVLVKRGLITPAQDESDMGCRFKGKFTVEELRKIATENERFHKTLLRRAAAYAKGLSNFWKAFKSSSNTREKPGTDLFADVLERIICSTNISSRYIPQWKKYELVRREVYSDPTQQPNRDSISQALGKFQASERVQNGITYQMVIDALECVDLGDQDYVAACLCIGEDAQKDDSHISQLESDFDEYFEQVGRFVREDDYPVRMVRELGEVLDEIYVRMRTYEQLPGEGRRPYVRRKVIGVHFGATSKVSLVFQSPDSAVDHMQMMLTKLSRWRAKEGLFFCFPNKDDTFTVIADDTETLAREEFSLDETLGGDLHILPRERYKALTSAWKGSGLKDGFNLLICRSRAGRATGQDESEPLMNENVVVMSNKNGIRLEERQGDASVYVHGYSSSLYACSFDKPTARQENAPPHPHGKAGDPKTAR